MRQVDFVPVSTVEVDAVVGKSATLPCDIETETNEDRVYMVLWFRHAGGKPLYSFDVRGRGFNKALHWSDPHTFGQRAYFVTISRPAALTIDGVQLDDEGLYRCRVDFKNSPTRNFQIKLNVIVPPHQMLLYDSAGKDLAGVIGPLEEGGDFALTCELRGGRPSPMLTWVIDSTPIEKTERDRAEGNTIISKLTLRGAKRNWLNATVRCQANNTRLQSPYERSARIEMLLRPTSVAIVDKPKKMLADREVVLVCISYGSRPAAQITWYRANMKYEKGQVTEYSNETTTFNQLVMIPEPDDDGITMRCRAENTILNYGLEDNMRMLVVYKPVVNLILGTTLKPQDIKEGDDVYFECNVQSNPKEYRIRWYHNGFPINRTSATAFISTKSLVLQKVTRHDSGVYTCRVVNEIGDTLSSPVYLRVQYMPYCTQTSPMLIGAQIDEPMRVKCTVTADPAVVTFFWQFNNSGESFQVSPHRYSPPLLLSTDGGTVSELRYRAASERDYGALYCTANNPIGVQKDPCVFQVVPATRPAPPRNCTPMVIPRQSEPLLAVNCTPGYDGGLRQYYTLEIHGPHAQVLVNTSAASTDGNVWLNVTWDMLEVIEDEDEIVVIARNNKGPAEPVILNTTGMVFKPPMKNDEKKPKEDATVAVAATLIALLMLVAVAGALAALAFKKRPETATAVASKRPSQSVVQVDGQGRRCLFAYPASPDKEVRPDVINPRPDTARPRVVLESNDGNAYMLHDLSGDLRGPPRRPAGPEEPPVVRAVPPRRGRIPAELWV
ncbi:B-cell receptor CD22-like [Pectinophora gossypiella]|uniref:B-cell receptor CD22-like n=1 Tax=Pectinophora gossypiella TaxID=13191 RepID=UPI00214ED273|nr:B-cell receptor CD22-like [Pectinophora gossypiella]